MRYIRQDSGRVACGAVEIVNFLLKQVEFYSKRKWDGKATRAITKQEWIKAQHFQAVLQTSKVQHVLHNGLMYYVCHGRADGHSGNEEDRVVITVLQAIRSLKILDQLSQGKEVPYSDLQIFLATRVFWYDIRSKM